MVRVPLVSLLLLTTLLPWAVPAAGEIGVTESGSPSEPIFFEDWEDGLDNWTSIGSATVDCDVGAPGCSLFVNPPCCHTYEYVRRGVDIPLTNGTTVSFTFRGSSLYGDTDAYLNLILADGSNVELVITEWFNNELSLIVPNHGRHIAFGQWSPAETWYGALIRFDPDNDRVRAEVHSESGVVARSNNVSIPAAADRIVQIDFVSVFWGGARSSYHYDTLCAYDGAVPAACRFEFDLNPLVMMEADPAHGAAPLDVTFHIQAAPAEPDLVLARWTLDFGDGNATSGAGAPPAAVTHTYHAYGRSVAVLRVEQSDGHAATRTASILVRSEPPVLTNVTHTPETPQAHSAFNPLRTDAVTVSADIVDPEGTPVAAWVCWYDGHPLRGYNWWYCDDMVETSPGHHEYELPPICTEGTLWYRVSAADAHGDAAWVNGEVHFEGALGGFSLGCYTEPWMDRADALQP